MQAIILCGGKGERLRPLTDSTPKPLIPIRGKPIVDYIVKLLEDYGVANIIVAAGYKSEQFYEHFRKNPRVRVVDSGDVDIVERLVCCAPFIEGEFFVLYGDTVSDVDFSALVNFHRERSEKVTVTAWPLRTHFGVMDLAADGKVTAFQEKPQLDKWINIGHFYFSGDVKDEFKKFRRFQDFLVHLVKVGELNAYCHLGVHITVNTKNELEEAEEAIRAKWG